MPEETAIDTQSHNDAQASFATHKPSLGRVIAAWGVHAFTISGLVWATLALFAILNNNIPMMWLWLVIALVVDGVDGTRSACATPSRGSTAASSTTSSTT